MRNMNGGGTPEYPTSPSEPKPSQPRPGHRIRRKLFGSKVRTVVTIVAASTLFAGVAFAIFFNVPVGNGNQQVTTGHGTNTVTLTVTGTGDFPTGGGSSNAGLQPQLTAPTLAAEEADTTGTIAQVIFWSITTPVSNTAIQTAAAAPGNDGNGNVMNYTGDVAVPGCLASWYVVSPPVLETAAGSSLTADIANEAPLVGAVLNTGQTYTAFSVVYMISPTSTTNQDACEGVSPLMNLAIN